MEETKVCRTCKFEFPIDNFHFRDKASGKRRPDCAECRNLEKRLAKENPKPKQIGPKFDKACTKCKQVKPRSEFTKSGNHLRGKCKQCEAEERKAKNPPRPKIVEKTRYICKTCKIEKDKDEFYARGSGVRGECKECTRKRKNKWRQDNAEKNREYNKNYRANPEKKELIKKYQSEHYKNYKPKKRELERINYKKRYNSDENYKIRMVLRSRMRCAIKKEFKSDSAVKLLGCNIDDFRQWLEYQFDENMTWQNHGEYWHIDHIKPCSLFNLSDCEEQKRCFHWTNMQPLEGSENIIKSNNYTAQMEYFANQKLRDYLVYKSQLECKNNTPSSDESQSDSSESI